LTAYLFPGQLDSIASAAEVDRLRPDLRVVASVAAGADPFLHPPDDPRFEQPAVVALSLARWSARRDPSPALSLLGHSAGELSALAAAGALSETDAIWLAAVRGRLMAQAAEEADAAALVLRGASLTAVRQLARAHALAIAQDNAPRELILAGRSHLVEAAARTARRLEMCVVGPTREPLVPSPELTSARNAWRAALLAAEVRTPRIPVFSTLTVRRIVNPRLALAEAMTAAVRFRQAILALDRLGVRRFVCVGPGAGLARLVQCTLTHARVEALAVAPRAEIVLPSPWSSE
jgi:[acyl-carrier-protein] S-malonyltransferase